jgi:putative membrane protein
MIYLWLKAFHLIAIVCWFAGLFYLPRLFVYHADAHDFPSYERFKIMEKKLHNIIMIPSLLAVFSSGACLFYLNWPVYLNNTWFKVKIACVLALALYQLRLVWHMKQFRRNRNIFSRRYFIVINEIPSLFLIFIIILVVVKPFQGN